jgi:amino acid transporter
LSIGLDLASVMGDEIRDPGRNLPISILLGGAIAGFIYLGTTLSISQTPPGISKLQKTRGRKMGTGRVIP